MSAMNRRQFGSLAVIAATHTRKLFAAADLNQTLRESMTRRKIPAVVAMVATPDKTTYTGAFGKRDSASGIDVKPDSIFAIASMTKAITAAAAINWLSRAK
jgi:CubicO group peptidase (beta-lactamase class C family)